MFIRGDQSSVLSTIVFYQYIGHFKLMFRWAAAWCENGGTPNVVVRSKDIFVPPIVSHPNSEAIHLKMSKI
jgi:hypothetical protein